MDILTGVVVCMFPGGPAVTGDPQSTTNRARKRRKEIFIRSRVALAMRHYAQ